MSAPKIRRSPSQRKQQEDMQLQQYRLLSKVMLMIPDIIHIWDIIGQRQIYFNRNVLEMLGDESLGTDTVNARFLMGLMHPDDLAMRADERASFLTAKDGEVVEYEYRLRAADDQWYWFAIRETVFTRNKEGLPRQLIGSAQDISARKSAETALRESERVYRLLADNVIDVIAHIDENL